MTRVLVTGASGFIGCAVCEAALSLGMKVRGSHRSPGSEALVPAGVETIPMASLDRDTDWSRVLAGVDVVVHLAARVHVAKDNASDLLAAYREVNTAWTERLARAAAAAGAKRMVYVSTIKVNGEQTSTEPFRETDVPQPDGPYAISKWESEQALHRIGVESGLEIVILRPPLVYGEGAGANFLRLLGLVRRRIPLPLASVKNLRSLVYVKNLANAITMGATHPRAVGQTFLVSDGEDVSTPELIRHIADAMGFTVRLLPCPPRALNLLGNLAGKSEETHRLLSSLVIDSTKIRAELGWAPRYTMSQGLRETVAWYSANGLPKRRIPVNAITAQ